jgi:hypothetical protein
MSRLSGLLEGVPPLSLGRPLPLHPLILGAYAVLYVYAANVAEVAPEDVVAPLLVVLAGVLIVLAGVTLVFRDARRGALVISASVAMFFAYGHIARAITPLHVGGVLQVAAWLFLIVVAIIVAIRIGGRLVPTTRALNAAGVVLIALSLITIVPYELGGVTRGAPTAIGGGVPSASGSAQNRDIYYLIFDRYGSNWSLRYHFGVEKNDLPDWLAQHGFYVASQTHANYASTSESLLSSLDMTHLDELTRLYGRQTGDYSPVFKMLKQHTVGKFLKAHGYRYIHLGSWWKPTQDEDDADVTYRYSNQTEFSGVLLDTTLWPRIAPKLGIKGQSFRERVYGTALFQFQKLREIPSERGPKFVFAHILLPHPPYVFAADGRFLTETEVRTKSLNELFAGQLAFTNSQIKPLIERLLSGSEDRRPIIIVQADEGPKPLRDDVDWRGRWVQQWQVRHGILNAYSFPGLSDTGLYPSITPVNSFRLLLDRYFGADLPLLPDRSYRWPGGHIFAYRDISDLLKVPIPDGERAWTPLPRASSPSPQPSPASP